MRSATISSSDFVVSIRLAMKAGFAQLVFWMLILMLTSAYLGSAFSGRQPATVGLDVGLSALRLFMPILAALLIQELITKEFDRKLFLISLTYPRPRQNFLFGRVAAIGALLLVVLVIAAIFLATLTLQIGKSYPQATPPDLSAAYIVTIIFIALDLLVLLAIGTLIAVTTTTPSFVLIGTLGFMLVARSYSVIISLLTRDTTLVGSADTYQSSLSLLGYLLPDLAALDVRMISLYGQWQFLPDDWTLQVIATLTYAATLFALSVWALNRKKFA